MNYTLLIVLSMLSGPALQDNGLTFDGPFASFCVGGWGPG